MSGITQLFLILLIGLFIYVVVKLAPYYYENFLVKVSLNNYSDNYKLGMVRDHELRKRLMDQFRIDGIESVNVQDIAVKQNGNNKVLLIQYEVSEPMFANIEAVMRFSNSVEMSRP